MEGAAAPHPVGRPVHTGGMPDSKNQGTPAAGPGAGGPARPPDGNGDVTQVLEGIRALHGRLAELERLIARGDSAIAPELKKLAPAWRRVTQGEPRWHVAIAMLGAIALQLPLPGRLVLFQPAWIMPVIEAALLVTLTALNPRRINRESQVLRALSLAFCVVLSLANAWSAARLVIGLVNGTEGNSAASLLISGGVIWLTNIIVFGLWYWEFDRGGPVARANATHMYPDFQFVQMTSPDMAPPHWEPMFGDYLYLAFTNATAFSPTDVMPLSRWAKGAMALQSMVSIVVVALVVARAVNILK
jgi:uncharacterized membrane protein